MFTVNFQRNGRTVESVSYPTYSEALSEVCDYRWANGLDVDYKYLNARVFFVNDK